MQDTRLDNLTIVLQGRMQGECVRHMVSRYRKNIIISTWETENLDECGNLDGVRIVRSSVPVGDIGPTNMMLQFTSTIAGLSASETKYAIKMRGDEYYSNLEGVNSIVKMDDRIHCIPVFMPRHSVRPYCVGDHLLAGSTAELKSMFLSAKRWWEMDALMRTPDIPLVHQIPECILGACYIHEKSGGDMNPSYMKKYFSVMSLDMLKDYKITWNNSGDYGKKHAYYNDFDPTADGRDSILDIDQIME